MATDEITERVAVAMRDHNEPGVDIHEGGYIETAAVALHGVEAAGLAVLPIGTYVTVEQIQAMRDKLQPNDDQEMWAHQALGELLAMAVEG